MTVADAHTVEPTPHASSPGEQSEVHTRLLRLALGIEEARAYWAHVDPATPMSAREDLAFEQRWFGAKTSKRVTTLLHYMAARYDAFPEALAVLRRWRDMDPSTRQVICHWHLQLTDPIYRSFSSKLLLERRSLLRPSVDRPAIVRWVRETYPNRWGEATLVQFGSKLLSAASEAGLVSAKRDPRTLLFPRVPDRALEYLLHLLRSVRHTGTLLENPYLASVGLTGAMLEQRLRTVPSVRVRRMHDVVELDWDFANLGAWAEASL